MGSSMDCKNNPCCGDRLSCFGKPKPKFDAALAKPASSPAGGEVREALLTARQAIWSGGDTVKAIAAIDAALSPSTSAAEPVGEIVMFEGVGKEVSWRKGKLPPIGTKLYANADDLDHFHAARAAYFAAGGQRHDPQRDQKISHIQTAIRDGKDGILYAHPAPAAVESAQGVKEAVEAEREACAVLVDTMARYASNQSLLDNLHKVSDAIRSRASLATEKEG